MRVVSRRTGLKPDLIRAWERRYRAVTPQRTSTGQRTYTEEEIDRLALLRAATLSGYSIGRIAHLPNDKLTELVTNRLEGTVPADASISTTSEKHLVACMSHIRALDEQGLERQLERSAMDVSRPKLIDEILAPLMVKVGRACRRGSLRPMHEHLATVTVRRFAEKLRSCHAVSTSAPRLVVTTPALQFHEIGAQLAATVATSEGWRVTYLGPNLPSEDIAAAVHQKQATGLALSINFPPDDVTLAEELDRLCRLLPPHVSVMIGGAAARNYEKILRPMGVHVMDDFATFRRCLSEIRFRTTIEGNS